MEEVLTNYELKHKRKTLLGELNIDPANDVQKTNKDKLKSTAEGLGRDLIIGVIGGGLAGAVLGKYSFLLGLGVAGFGHYSESKTMAALGLGMMASGTFYALTGKEQDPNKPLMEKVTERVEAFKTDLKSKLWVDKFYEKKEAKDATKVSTQNLNGTETINKQKNRKENERFERKKEKDSNVNNNELEGLTSEEEAFLQNEISEIVDTKIAEFYEQKKMRSTKSSNKTDNNKQTVYNNTNNKNMNTNKNTKSENQNKVTNQSNENYNDNKKSYLKTSEENNSQNNTSEKNDTGNEMEYEIAEKVF